MDNEIKNFENIIDNNELLRGIYSYGFEIPSNIQYKSIPIITEGKDLIAQSQSGTGKTGSFSIGILNNITTKKELQKLILTPTHELTIQVYTVINELSKFMDITVDYLIGKTSINESIEKLKKQPQIVVGTPGIILDMINRIYLFTEHISTFVCDEADEILSSGFISTMYDIIKTLPKNCQICLFSATLPTEIVTLTDSFLNKPEKILINKEELTLEGIKQFYINTNNYNWKYDTIIDLYNKISINQCIIYINMKSTLDTLYTTLIEDNYPVSYISSNLPSSERKEVLNDFKSGKCRILLSTDLLSRGIDIQQLSLVINFDIPRDKETYIHRIGRSGRYGRKGVAINLVSNDELYKVNELNKYYDTKIEEMPVNIDDYL